MKRGLFAALALAGTVACAGAQNTSTSPLGLQGSREVAAVSAPAVELGDARGAVVAAKTIPMDGVAEGLAWPALRAALDRKPGDHGPLAIAVARSVPTSMVMRAVWTLRDADIRLQTPDAMGTVHVLELRPKPDASSSTPDAACHAAVFVEANGDLRVAAPGGPHSLRGDGAAGALASALSAERARCAIRYVGFGAENAEAPWSLVFDVARAVDREKSAGDARYVLAEVVHAGGR
jgi:hypothetical protein